MAGIIHTIGDLGDAAWGTRGLPIGVGVPTPPAHVVIPMMPTPQPPRGIVMAPDDAPPMPLVPMTPTPPMSVGVVAMPRPIARSAAADEGGVPWAKVAIGLGVAAGAWWWFRKRRGAR